MPTVKRADRDRLPHNADAERQLIGSILVDPSAIHLAREEDLRPDDFYVEENRDIYEAMITVADRFQKPSYIQVAGACDSVESSELASLMADTATSVHARQHAATVRQLSRQRALIRAGAEIVAAAHSHEGPLDELYDDVSESLFDAMERAKGDTHMRLTDEVLMGFMESQMRLAERLEENPDALIRTYWPNVDRMITSLDPGMLQLVAADTSVGKTVFMENVAESNTMRGHQVAFYHLELSPTQMLYRRFARMTGVPVRRWKQGYWGEEGDRALDKMDGWVDNLCYVHCPGWSAGRIASDIVRLHARGECDLAVVDYMQKIPLPGASNYTTARRIGENVETLKTCIERLGIPMVLGSQVSRYGGDRPTLRNMRGSGEIEEKVNQVVILHRPQKREPGQKTELIEVYVDKNESGATGKVELYHRLGRYRFEAQTDPNELGPMAHETEPIPI